MPPIIIGDLSLDDTYAPLVNLSYEYFKTQGGEILGGIQKYTISGVVTIGDKDGLSTGANVMTKLKNIRQLGKKTKCTNVTIPGFYTGMAKITNVTIGQGSDPSWVNQGEFSIELSAALTTIPPNKLGITVDDCITDFSKSESVEIGEDAHGYVLLDGPLTLSKTYVKFSNKINLTCKPLCPSMGGSTANPISVLRRLFASGPTHTAFSKYATWKPFLQSRSLEISTEGSVSFSADIILLPPSSNGNAFVDLEFEHSRTYDSKQTTKRTSGTVTGLVPILWSDLVTISDTSSASKLANAETVFTQIKNAFKDESSWGGLTLELQEKPNCPIISVNSIGACGNSDDEDDDGGCFQPTNSTISKSRTEGTITFNFEWSTVPDDEQCTDQNNKRTEVTVDITEPQATIVEHVVPDFGTLIQNLNCRSAKTIEFTSTTTDPSGEGGCSQTNECTANDAINKEIEKYVPNNDPNWLLIGNSITRTYTSISLKKKFIRKCITQ